ncbi:hypothetical protein CPB86DRAFT_786515 [Serendipita vermifera]|nr:hypothetical protein CPB86DRAFT_786515 [Serendipita vermifera]
MASYKSNKPHEGAENILIGFDIGTTQSAVSFSYVYPGEHPEVRPVIKWPGQPESSGDSKIPTIIAYQNGKAQAFGAEAREFMDDEDYEMASWFKLHLHPESMKISDLPPPYENPNAENSQIEIPNLPHNTTLSQIYSNFIEYLYIKTKKFFIESSPNGQQVWDRLESRIVMIFCIPNGWDISQQTFIHKAVIESGIIGEGEADERIDFITEGEASVHYALAHTSHMRWVKSNFMFTIIDAGGSTIDSTLYECKTTEPLCLEEVCASECVQAGGVYVDRAARRILEEKLGDSPFNEDEYLKEMVNAFEKKTKRLFDGTQPLNVLEFGRARDNDRAHGILKGKIGLTAEEVSKTFDDTVSRTIASCLKLLRGRKVQNVLLVGGFGDSPFLRKRLADYFADQGTDIVTIDEPSKKAASEGSVIWYIKRLVTMRKFRFTIGTGVGVNYDSSDELHLSRQDLIYHNKRGRKRIETFQCWAEKDTPITEDWSFTATYRLSWQYIPNFIKPLELIVYGCDQGSVPTFMCDTSGNVCPGIRRICTIKADFDDMMSALRTETGPEGAYWYLDFEVVVSFRNTKLQGRLQWKNEQGGWEEGPTNVLPETIY